MRGSRALAVVLAAGLAGCGGFVRVFNEYENVIRQAEFRFDTHGSDCQPTRENQLRVSHEAGGTYNDSNVLAYVVCPVPMSEVRPPRTYMVETKVLRAELGFADRNPVIPFRCHVFATADDGARFWSAPRWACGLDGGCDTVLGTSSFVGVEYLDWRLPFGDLGVPYGRVGYYCSIPPSTERGPASAVTWTSTAVWTTFTSLEGE
ncbi:MAG TPA: hypothetical protein VKA21_11995 [Candidatus Binatia bacterium]|nr:hypothetical protein [Candidatus Binatia bacterium]